MTPGPWEVQFEPDEWNCLGGNGVTKVVAPNADPFNFTICGNFRYYPVAPSVEDMRLIAAAPDMYEALRGMVERFGTLYPMNEYDMSQDAMTVCAARATIAKAEGK